jgi:hypothetical protein
MILWAKISIATYIFQASMLHVTVVRSRLRIFFFTTILRRTRPGPEEYVFTNVDMMNPRAYILNSTRPLSCGTVSRDFFSSSYL